MVSKEGCRIKPEHARSLSLKGFGKHFTREGEERPKELLVPGDVIFEGTDERVQTFC